MKSSMKKKASVLALLLCIPLLAVTVSSSVSIMRIQVEGADSILEKTLVSSEDLIIATRDVTPRILVEYADSIFTQGLEEPRESEALASEVSPKILVEYADSIFIASLKRPPFIPSAPTPKPTSTSTPKPTPTPSPTPTPTPEENHPPVISSLTAEQDSVAPGEKITIVATASDPDQDTLIYSWSSDEGVISGAGAIATWRAPEKEGVYSIILEVDDERGGIEKRTISIQVVSEAMPLEDSMLLTIIIGIATSVVAGLITRAIWYRFRKGKES